MLIGLISDTHGLPLPPDLGTHFTGVDLILHGHDHVHSTMWFDGPRGRIPAIGVPSASAIAHGHPPAAAYNLFKIARDGAQWRCEQHVRGWIESKGIRDIRRVTLIPPQR